MNTHLQNYQKRMMEKESFKYPIGTQYLPMGKNAKVCTITECFKTYDSKGNLVRTHYQSTHDFLGQSVTNHNVCETTIARGIENLKGKQ
jgi:hypothetical protein